MLFFGIIFSLVHACEETSQEVHQYLKMYYKQNKIYCALNGPIKDQLKLIDAALQEDANPNEILPIISEKKQRIIRYAPPLAYSTDIHCEILDRLVAAGANIYTDVLLVEKHKKRLVSIPHFFIESGMKNAGYISPSRNEANKCYRIIQALIENGTSKDQVLKIIRNIKDSVTRFDEAFFLGWLYHTLFQTDDKFSEFIASINKGDFSKFKSLSNENWINQYDPFGVSPMCYALYDYNLTSPTPIFEHMLKIGVDIYQSFFKDLSIHPYKHIYYDPEWIEEHKDPIHKCFFDVCSWCEEKVHISQMNRCECKHTSCSACSERSMQECLLCSPLVTYYAILGVSKSASLEEIKNAYRKLSLCFHPDKNKNLLAAEKMKRINICRDTLTDPDMRKQYDHSLNH